MKRVKQAVLPTICLCALIAYATADSPTTSPSGEVVIMTTARRADTPSSEAPPPKVESSSESEPATTPATQATTAPKDKLASLSLKGAPIEQVCKFLSEKLDKPVIPTTEAMKKKITIISPKKFPLDQAIPILRAALLSEGITLHEYPDHVRVLTVEEALKSRLQVVGFDESVSEISDKTRIVDKVFLIKYYDVLRIKDLVLPTLSTFGHILADPNIRKLIVTDTVRNLEQIEELVKSLDVEAAEQTITRIIKIKDGDVTEIVAIVRHLLSGVLGKEAAAISVSVGGSPSRGGSSPSSRGRSPSRGKDKTGASATFVQPSKAPVVLVPWISRNWIIAVAPAEIMGQIEKWVKELDVAPGEVEKVYDSIPVKHANVQEVAQRITETIQSMPDTELSRTIRVVPFEHSRTLIVFGSQQGRELVKNMVKDLDVASSSIEREFKLIHEDAESVAERLQELFSQKELSYEYSSGHGYSSRSYRHKGGAVKVVVVPDARRNTVTVITDKATMEKVAKTILDWDQPLDLARNTPKAYTLKYADAAQVQKLLTDMFARRERASFWDRYFGTGTETTPVGRLFGQFSFEAMPNSNKLLVTTQHPEYYGVIDKLIEQLDQPQEAGLPEVIELKHANAEDLCEQLNALLAERGTIAEILRSKKGLSDRTEADTSGAKSSSGGSKAASETSQGMMPFWWQKGSQSRDEMPTSNLIGKIRFVPVYRRNELMVCAPPAYIEPIKKLIEQLDQPGRQVLIHAIIAEIQHDDVTTLGFRFAADPALLNDPRILDTAIGGSGTGQHNQLYGGTFSIGSNTFGRTVLQANVNVSALLQLLMREFSLKILFEPKLYTADNQEAEFFDGQDFPFQTESQTSAEGGSISRNFDYKEVGTRLRIRPHITLKRDVDLLVNLELSRVVPGESVFGNSIFDRRETTTHVIVKNGQTVMLSGIVRQEDFDDVRKLPLLGDIPWIGKLFRSVDKAQRNRELVAFITPHVIEHAEDADEEMKHYREVLERIKKEMGPQLFGNMTQEGKADDEDKTKRTAVTPDNSETVQSEETPKS